MMGIRFPTDELCSLVPSIAIPCSKHRQYLDTDDWVPTRAE